jgi:outer membrane lipoprotein LolB
MKTEPPLVAMGTDQATDKSEKRLTSSGPLPSSWELSGAMAARSKNKAWSASVNWMQRGTSNYQIRLFGPLGSGTVLIARQGGAISYRDGPKSATSNNADELLKQQTGVRLPVADLYYWVRGVPAPGAIQSAQRDQGNHLVVLRQAGYTIEYLGYSMVGKTALPNHIRLTGNGVFIKMVIKRWRI